MLHMLINFFNSSFDGVQALFIRVCLGDSEAQQASNFFGVTGENPITVICRTSSVVWELGLLALSKVAIKTPFMFL